MLIPSNTAAEAYELNGNPVPRHRYREGYITAVSAGFFFILVGMFFVVTPNLYDKVIAFFRDFDAVSVPNMQHVLFPAPTTPNEHMTVYTVAGQFSLIWGFFQIAILALRFVGSSPLHKKAETASNAVFWLGTNYLISTYLNEASTITTWFTFWTLTVMLIGVSLIVRAIILASRM